MVPSPGESPGEWWANTGHAQAMADQAERLGTPTGGEEDMTALFFHDVPPEVTAEALRHERNQSSTPFEKPWPLDAWPDVTTRFLLCRRGSLLPR